jgi:hypothetical protein
MGKSEGRGPLVRPRRRMEDNIKMDAGEIRFGSMNSVLLA